MRLKLSKNASEIALGAGRKYGLRSNSLHGELPHEQEPDAEHGRRDQRLQRCDECATTAHRSSTPTVALVVARPCARPGASASRTSVIFA